MRSDERQTGADEGWSGDLIGLEGGTASGPRVASRRQRGEERLDGRHEVRLSGTYAREAKQLGFEEPREGVLRMKA